MRNKSWPTPLPNSDCQLPPSDPRNGNGADDSYTRGSGKGDSQSPRRKMNVRLNANFRTFVYATRAVSDRVLPDDPKRSYLAFQNRGTNAIFIGFGSPANDKVFRLVAGGFYEPFIAPSSSVHILGVAAGDEIVIIEGTS